jgi:homoserine O-acetyltransferase
MRRAPRRDSAAMPDRSGRQRRRGGGLARIALAAALVLSAPEAVRAETQIFSLYDVPFEDGTIVPEVKLAYDTRGTLSPTRDNAIVLLHDLFGDRNAFDELVGPGKTFDTDKYFVISADALGGGESSSPADGKGQDFPRYTIRDMVAVEYALVSRGLGLSRLRAVAGRSMGGFMALEWGIAHPEMAQSLILVAPSPRSDANLQVVLDLLVSAIALDPEWDGGHYAHDPVEGLRHAGMIYYPWAVTGAYLDHLPPRDRGRESEATARSFAQWDANSLVLRLAACRGHDVAAPFGGDLDKALARATMPVLLLASPRDRFIGSSGVQRLRAGLAHPTYAEIPSELGHRATTAPPGTPEGALIDRAIRSFLAATAERARGE